MNFADWYTDTFDLYRVTKTEDGSLTRQAREQIATGVPCRLYQKDTRPITMAQDAASVNPQYMLACDLSVDVRAGDELRITRGGALGHTPKEIRAFAAEPNPYYEPFGAALPGLAHQQIKLYQKERVGL